MDNSKPHLPESQPESESQSEATSSNDSTKTAGINDWINRTSQQAKGLYKDGKEYYRSSPRLQKVVYQGKFMPAFWTVACIFSLVVNIILIGLLITVGHLFFQLKTVVSDGLVTQASNSLSMMDKAHIVQTVTVDTSVRLQDTLPVNFDLPINESTQLSLAEATTINGAYIYLNNTAVQTDLTLPAGTPLQAKFNMNIPVSTTVPVDFTVPINMKVPVDIAIDQTDLHQSIVGLQDALTPYKTVLGTTFNSPADFSICRTWITGWLCGIILGKQ
jgi:hypothetical protein